MRCFRAIPGLLLFLTWALAALAQPAHAADSPERLVIYIDADNARVRSAVAKIANDLTGLGVAARHRVVVRHLAADVWNADDIEAKVKQAVSLRPAAIIASNSLCAGIAKRVTPGVPVVFVSHQDPIRIGLVASLARPGGNLTGFTYYAPIDLKRIELLRQLAPGAKRLGILVDRWWMDEYGGREILREARGRLGFAPELFHVETISDLKSELSGARARAMDAWYVPYTGLPFDEPAALLSSVSALGKPVVFPATLFVERGGLVSYQQTLGLEEAIHLLATMVGLILDGVPPGEIPIERPKAFELAINVAAARRAGVAIPAGLLKRADRVFLGEPRLQAIAQ